jgi:hypothetical protein
MACSGRGVAPGASANDGTSATAIDTHVITDNALVVM